MSVYRKSSRTVCTQYFKTSWIQSGLPIQWPTEANITLSLISITRHMIIHMQWLILPIQNSIFKGYISAHFQGEVLWEGIRYTLACSPSITETAKERLVLSSDQEATDTVKVIKNTCWLSVSTLPTDCSTTGILSRASPAGLARPAQEAQQMPGQQNSCVVGWAAPLFWVHSDFCDYSVWHKWYCAVEGLVLNRSSSFCCYSPGADCHSGKV